MSDENLLHLITSYGTRKRCTLNDIMAQYGSHHSWQMHEDLNRLVKQGKIKIEGPEVFAM